MKSVMMFLLFCFVPFIVTAQNASWDDFVDQVIYANEEQAGNAEALLEDLENIHLNPFNLNEVTMDELRRLPFLTDDQCEAILQYVYYNKPLLSVGELIMLKELDYETRSWLGLFLEVRATGEEQDKIPLRQSWYQGKHECMGTLDIPLYTRSGYKTVDDEVLLDNPNKVYLGSKYAHRIDYNYHQGKNLAWGLSVQQDAGEPFARYGNKGYDTYAYHFFLAPDTWLKALALGHYRITIGQGLILNTGYSLSKMQNNLTGSSSQVLRTSTSTQPACYLQGAALTVGWKGFAFTPFYSCQARDAVLTANGDVSSITTTGLHRTLRELQRKNNVKEQLWGADLSFKNSCFNVGLAAVMQQYSRSFSTGTALYKKYYFQGNHFMNVSAHYLARYQKLTVQGEVAYSDLYSSWATLNQAGYRFSHRYSVQAIQRFYDYRYRAVRAHSFSEGGRVNDESGVYLSFQAQPINDISFSVYADCFYFAWPGYASTQSTSGYDLGLTTHWLMTDRSTLHASYQVKRKERNGDMFNYNKVKMKVDFTPSATCAVAVTGRATFVSGVTQSTTVGYLVGASVKWNALRNRLRLAASGGYFDSDDYKAPMAMYEPTVLKSFGMKALYGQGMRTAWCVKWDVTPHVLLVTKYALSHYFDRDAISTGLQQIAHPTQQDVCVQLRIKLDVREHKTVNAM